MANTPETAKPITVADLITMKKACRSLKIGWNQYGGAPVIAVARDERAGNSLVRDIWEPLDAETLRAMSDEMWAELAKLAKKQASERRAYSLNSK